ncbi:acetyl-CoA hydrolase [Paraburkholderia unamae]|uniref:acetyl-CoA hydrolase/transferase family protein n=1 Tax=Paraburkholderia unamae TaxID=219649 RepID=UPI000DC5487F|nr:acetyl-CoA hydrolase/transferase C-terminal domain-containing protein [Paraburkholderia unamae]RAR68131.1 acetyl-CoA hydrolase [Paraburkholderia unamae]
MPSSPLSPLSAAAVDLSRHVRAGDRIHWGQGEAQPRTLIKALLEQRHRLGRVAVLLGESQAGLLQPEHTDAIDFATWCGYGGNQALVQAGVLDVWPCHDAALPALIRAGELRVDVLFLQVSPPDALGRYSLGCAMDTLPAALDTARVVIAEVHAGVPWTHGERYLNREDFDVLVEADYPLDAPSAADTIDSTDARVRAIARHAAALIDDGATLQSGPGAIPDAILAQLADRRGLGLHTDTAGAAVVELAARGALTNEHKRVDRGIGVAARLAGGARLRRHAAHDEGLSLRGIDYLHDPAVLARLDRFTAINTAIEVDLGGQVNTEVRGGYYVGAVGGASAFSRAARASRGGLAIVALTSTHGHRSRIVASCGGPIGIARSDVDVIVTEYGVADLRGRGLWARLRAMLDIAAPEHRDALERQSHETLRGAGVDWSQLVGA